MQNLIIQSPESPGIYIIKCSKTKSVYIGSAKNLKERHREHKRKLITGNHHNRHLLNICNKYGTDSLSFHLIEYCNKKKLIEREQFYLDNTDNLVNICKIADSSLGVKRSKEQRDRISKMHKGNKYWVGRKHTPETKEKISSANKGRKHSDKSRKNMSKSQLGRKHSEETKKKMSKSRRINFEERNKKIREASTKHKAEQWDLEGNLLKVYDNVFDAAREMGYPRNSIYQAIQKNKYSIYKGHIWKRRKK